MKRDVGGGNTFLPWIPLHFKVVDLKKKPHIFCPIFYNLSTAPFPTAAEVSAVIVLIWKQIFGKDPIWVMITGH